jgi:uncharacterized protein
MVTDLHAISQAAVVNEKENDAFVTFLQIQDEAVVDDMVLALNNDIEPQIDCTQCGNCCKTLMINVTPQEAENLSTQLQQPLQQIQQQYLEEGLNQQFIIKQMPCSFLQGTVCSIYPQRFAGCREFPALQQKKFTKRLFTVMMHYGRCPIVFNVIEALKKTTGFTP